MQKNLLEIISNNLVDHGQDNLGFIKNKLECICLNTNNKEKNRYVNFIENILKKTNKNLSKNLDFIIIKNKEDYKIKKTEIDQLKKIFNNVEEINLNLSEEEDIYVPHKKQKDFLQNNNKVPEFGTKSGPNLLFFNSMKLLKKYNTTLLLETDCILSNDWLEKITNYVNNSNGFLISGASYDGLKYSKETIFLTHTNGVALYATGSGLFQSIMEHFEEYFKEYIKKMPHSAYDWVFRIFLDENLTKEENHYFWKFINRNCVKNNFIFNCCLEEDRVLCEKKLMNLYNYAILHKK